MNMVRTVSVVLLLVFPTALAVAEGYSAFYAQLVEMFQQFEDDNTGLTTMATLKIPIGGEFEGMATAYTAVAQDISFLESNPAGSATLKETELAVFHSNLIDQASMESIAFTRRWDQLGIGAGTKIVHVPFEGIDYQGREVSSGRYVEAVGGLNASYNLFSGFYFHGLSIGANLKYATRVVPESIAPGQSAITGLADIGVLTRFNLLKFYSARERNFSVGAALRNFGPEVMGEPVPTSAHFGLAYAPIRPVLLAADAIVPWNPFSDVPAERIGFAVGLRADITSFLRLTSGFTVQGGAPRFVIGNQIDIGDVRLSANYTIDYTTRFTRPDRFSLQASLKFGDHGRAELQSQVENLYLEGLIAFAEGELELSAALAEQALALNPRFDPARELVQLSQESLELQQEMESLETLGDS
ncbi:UPF0164 family protein [Spirochaeta africana]|uniref:Uncharacterized protein family (UPF0164) n=1 Tax=Spirochaeta africana (strain ATCC 700263 / DSM 8902 / Z-7692) TaxID=889378 RepID=H9UJQ3_SPIAZ|nr:UPF0164 family protein [Spirochaeta africana]AFG37746.1 Uncharacterized protein family (UPF0164) [Spirochaeta africana DSM 8902]